LYTAQAEARGTLCYNALPVASNNRKFETVPRIKSAIKRVLITERNRVRNRAWKSYIRSARNRVEEAAKGGKAPDVSKAMNEAFSKIDRAVTKGVLHKNTAARRKARLHKMVLRLAAATPKAAGKAKKAAAS
jgi:small subunit ribosomal protein S20